MPFLSLESFSSLPLPSRSSLNSLTCPTKPSFKFHLPPSPYLALPSQGGQVLRNGMGMVCTFPRIPHCSISVVPGYSVLFRLPSFPVGNTLSHPPFGGSDIISSIRLFDVLQAAKATPYLGSCCVLHIALSLLLGAHFTCLSSPLDSEHLEVKTMYP